MPGERCLPKADMSIGAFQVNAQGVLPHEMFSRDDAPWKDEFTEGTRVKLQGLSSKRGLLLNGKTGVIAGQVPDDAERVFVDVEDDSGTAERVKVRPVNLALQAAPA
eukprot:3738435-Amphidinium_carterae.1